MDNVDKIFPLVIYFVLGLNVLAYWIKLILKKNGYEVGWFSNHFQDIPNMWKLAKSTDNSKIRNRYFVMVISLVIGGIVFIISFFVMVILSF